MLADEARGPAASPRAADAPAVPISPSACPETLESLPSEAVGVEARRLLAELEGRPAESSRPPAAPATAVRWASPGLHVLGALAAAVLSLAFHGYGFGLEAQRVTIPLVRALQDPMLYSGDSLIESLRESAGWFWRALAWTTEHAPRETTFLVLHVLVTALRFGGVLAIGRALAPQRSGVAWLGLWLVFFGQAGVGFEALNARALTAGACAGAVGVWALASALSGRWLIAFSLAGAAGSLEPSYGAFAVWMIAFASLASPARRLFVPGVALAITVALAGRFDSLAMPSFGSSDELAALVRAFFPAPHFPSTFGAGNWLAVAVLVSLVVLSSFGSRKRTTPERRAVLMCVAVLGAWLVGGSWNELAPTAAVLELGIFRSSALLCCLVFPLFARWLVHLWYQARERNVSHAFVPAALFLLTFPGSAQSLKVSGPELWLPVASSVILGWATLCVPRSTGRLAGSALVFCTFTLFVQVVSSRAEQAARIDDQLEPWRDLQVWARDHTPTRARFLTPAYLSGFRVHSERGVVAEPQDGQAVLRSGAFAEAWRSWFVDFGGRVGSTQRSSGEGLAFGWFAQDHSELDALARRYGADYVVLSEPPRRFANELRIQEWPGDPVYVSHAFRVFEVNSPLVVR